jgi:acyl-CoA thioesterase-1
MADRCQGSLACRDRHAYGIRREIGGHNTAEVVVMTAEGAATLRYVALGDSYTIGTAVAEPERWPDQLVRALGGATAPLRLVANLAVNGFTSGDVIAMELPRLDELRPGFVTLLVGVNDVVQDVPDALYRTNIEQIFDDLLRRVPPARLLAVTTPDYTLTPAGADYGDPVARRAGIVRANATLSEIAAPRGMAVVDILDVSQRAATDRSLVAADGLHPSGAQYALWVDRIAPVVRTLLSR